MTVEPRWFQRESCWEMMGSWSIRASIWRGPYTSFCLGKLKTIRRP
jgi:hypothetical protein